MLLIVSSISDSWWLVEVVFVCVCVYLRNTSGNPYADDFDIDVANRFSEEISESEELEKSVVVIFVVEVGSCVVVENQIDIGVQIGDHGKEYDDIEHIQTENRSCLQGQFECESRVEKLGIPLQRKS